MTRSIGVNLKFTSFVFLNLKVWEILSLKVANSLVPIQNSITWIVFPAGTCSKLTIKTLEQGVNSSGIILEGLIASFQHECEVALNWFTSNKLTLYLNKFQIISINQSKSLHIKETMDIGNEKTELSSFIKPLGIEING